MKTKTHFAFRIEPHKVHNATSHDKYRDYLREECEAHHTVRDICDFSKHGPKLHRASVSVTDTKLIRRVIERLMISHKDGRTQLIDDVLEQIVASWDVIFPRDGL